MLLIYIFITRDTEVRRESTVDLKTEARNASQSPNYLNWINNNNIIID